MSVSAPSARQSLSNMTRTSGVMGLGYAIVALFFGGFGFWAATAPLSGAAIAQGSVAVSGENLVISHLEGGVVETIHVEDGDRLSAGDPIVTLDDTRPNADVQRLENRRMNLSAQLVRLRAERDGLDYMQFPQSLTDDAATHALQDVLDEQIAQFNVRQERFAAEFQILTQRIAGLNETVVGLEAQQASIAEQIEVLQGEADRREALLEQGLTVRSEYSEILRSLAALVGEAGRVEAEIARARISILEAQEGVVRLRTQIVEEAVAGINDFRLQLDDVEEQLQAAKDVLNRTTIRAPADAFVVNLDVNTPGTAIRSGATIAELLPVSSDLGITARVSVADVDVVKPGQAANLRFAALNLRTTPDVPGTVTYVSPDRLLDQQTGEPYFEVRLQIDELPAQVREDQVYPGMPVDALITTDERTFLEYLTRPVLDSLALAFREE
ncbi:MAG: HlyD family type I secretion periplasmic adaptor subunit [Pseudomonadota bacterium]